MVRERIARTNSYHAASSWMQLPERPPGPQEETMNPYDDACSKKPAPPGQQEVKNVHVGRVVPSLYVNAKRVAELERRKRISQNCADKFLQSCCLEDTLRSSR